MLTFQIRGRNPDRGAWFDKINTMWRGVPYMMKKKFFNSKGCAIDEASAAKSEWPEVSERGFCGLRRLSLRHPPSLMRKLTVLT